ncbi:hypothetical protein GCK32_001252 [Trichostrongylus colubriformis]|uniref:Uncharacterized protein n=1 Tax=Trichostrongylus colubriformis TaxID=6319 RepID=A0AAN8J1F8_TRICO
MEGLSEEERLKIQAVMACAELDAAANVVASPGTSTAVTPLSDITASVDPFSRTARERTTGPAQAPRLKQDREPPVSVRSTPSRSPSSISMQSDVSLPPMDGLSEKERAHIEAVMANAERDSMMSMEPQPTSEMMIPPGLEDLSEEERQQILAVMAAAGAEALAPPPPQIRRSGSATVLRPSPSASSVQDHQPKRPHTAMGQVPSDQIEVPGLEGLSASEQAQILAVMESARRDAEKSRPATAAAETLPLQAPPASLPITTPEMVPSITPAIPPGLDELSAEEREKIMAVMANAAMEEQTIAPSLPSPVSLPQPPPPPQFETPSEPIQEPVIIPRRTSEPRISPEQENRRPSEHMVRSPSEFSLKDVAEDDSDRRKAAEDRINSVISLASEDEPRDRRVTTSQAIESFGALEYSAKDQYRKEKPSRMSESVREQSPEEDLPGVDLSHLSPSEREQIRAVMRMAQMDDPGRREASQRAQYDKPDTVRKSDAPAVEKKSRQISMTSSSELGSPTRESGYGTTSTSYDHELGDFATKTERMYDVLEDAGEVREGAHSRNDSRADDRREDFDFTYSDARFSGLNDDSYDNDRYKVSLHDDSGVSVDAVEMDEDDIYRQEKSDWTGGRTRMWTTVFEGDESEQPADDVFTQQSPTADDGTDYALKEIEFDTGVVPSSKIIPAARTAPIPWTPMGIETPKKATPEITVTVHDDRMDSEDEESGSEDDDEYPDKVVAAPIAPTPTYEEVEQERQRQEQYGKEVLQQIQAFGEAADDEFDVQWAKSTLQRAQKKRETTVPQAEVPVVSEADEADTLSNQKHDTPLEITETEERRNPFLESPEDEDVSVDMEEVDVSRAAQFYQSHSLFHHRPGPVYTIPEDANECDGTIENTESRMIAREKKRQAARSVANSIIGMYGQPTATRVVATTTTAITSAPSTSTYTIIALGSGIHTRSVTSTVDSHIYSSHSHPQSTPSTVYTSSYLFSSSPLSLSNSVSTVTAPSHVTLDTVSEIPASISASIDKTMADIESLLDSVYTSDKSQPNLLYYDQKSFQQAPLPVTTSDVATTSTTSECATTTSTATPDSSSMMLSLSKPLGSTLESVMAHPEPDDDTSPRGLKRSPGMIISSDVFSGAKIHRVEPPVSTATTSTTTTTRTEVPAVDSFTSELPNTFDELKSSYKWLREISEDDGSSVGQEMGRRKLPSIPSYSSYSTTPSYPTAPPGVSYIPTSTSSGIGATSVVMPPQSMSPLAVQTDSLTKRPSSSIRSQTSPAPVYINASAPIPSTSSSYSIFGVSSTCTQTALPPEKLPNGHLPLSDYSRPSSVASGTSSLARSSIDPAIIPGASYQPTAKSKTALRQPVSVARTKPAYAPKIPNTLARVLLKKELKEALSRRREALEACEIEANQRQYIVHKMLVTGLLPEAREDDIPDVIHCVLPLELISGARVIPKPTHTVATQKNDIDAKFPSSIPTRIQFKSQPTSTSSASVQPSLSTPAARYQLLPSTSLRAQLDVERKPRLRDFGSARTVETQTEQISSDDYAFGSHLTKPSTSQTPSPRTRSNANVQTNDLLEATKKYFEDYDRQLNELTEKVKRAQRRQFEFHDDDPLSRETRRLQLMDELARRRERMLANMDLPSDTMPYRAYHSQLALDSSDYSSLVPHYGSLPRIDYPSRNKRSPLTRDFTVRQQPAAASNYAYNYGSLPRNYERCLGQQFNPIQVDYEQSFGARPTQPGSMSRSMFDLHSDNIIDPRYRMPPSNIRSLNYLDQLGIDRGDPLAYSTSYRTDPYVAAGRQYASDTANLQMPSTYGLQQNDMISRYATYLNNEFQTGLLSQ